MNLSFNFDFTTNPLLSKLKSHSSSSFLESRLSSFIEKYLYLYNLLNNSDIFLKEYSCFIESYVEMCYKAKLQNLITDQEMSDFLEIPLPHSKQLFSNYTKEKNSKHVTLKKNLDNLTLGLSFNSESSYPFTVKVISPCTANNLDFSQYLPQDYTQFFQPLIKEEQWFDSTELTLARRYLSLFNFLNSHLFNLRVYIRQVTDSLSNNEKFSEIIICGEANNLVVLLKTKAIYT